MFSDQTYEVILARMLARVPEKFDKREGSIIYDALAPAAAELTQAYIQLDVVLSESFADTASRVYLIARAAEQGIYPFPASKAVLKGVFTGNNGLPFNVPLGSRFSLDDLNYMVTENISDGNFKVECETEGTAGNLKLGSMMPIQYIQNLASAVLSEVLIPGEDEEETEAFRKRYFDSLNAEAFGGNIKDYKEKTNALPGVGGVKVYPTWNGGGTVRLAIVASDYSVPVSDLIDSVQTAIDPTENQGKGVGIAPIGHVVTVTGVTTETVDIVTEVTYQEGWDWNDVKPYAEAAVDSYFKELSQSWADNDFLIVRISQIEIRFLDLPGVVDIANTTLNGVAQNLTLGADEIPVRGDVHD